MSYKPPFARMRVLRKQAPPPLQTTVPANVEEALKEAAAKAEEPAEEIRISVGAVDAVVRPGEDGEFGTADDEMSIEAPLPEPEPAEDEVVEDEVVEDEPVDVEEAPSRPEYSFVNKKAELIALAEDAGLDSSGTKGDIIARLDDHYDALEL